MANRHIVREKDQRPEDKGVPRQGGARGALVSSIMGDIEPWRRLRDGEFESLWDEFYYKWRGFWSPQLKTSKRERSKLTAPLTSMAVDLTVAEITEAVFGREYFIDTPDDIADEDVADMDIARKQLVQDLKNADFVDEFGLIAQNGALYGTGLCKIKIGTNQKTTPVRQKDGTVVAQTTEVVEIKPIAIEPGQFVPDPGARTIDEMKGCAHEFTTPLHNIWAKQLDGTYYADVSVVPFQSRRLMPGRGDTEDGNVRRTGEVAFITEYYGKVPLRMFIAAEAEGIGTELPEGMLDSIDPREMVEVIATIANEGFLLRIIENPLVSGERLIMSYQHESVPARFWGRGVCEKASNVQRAMDAEMRARIDALAWSNNPMFAGDLTRMPPKSNLNAWPGKFWGTRGAPKEVLQEFRVTGPDANSFAHMQDLERMGQQATGALDSIMSLRAGVRDETATGSALSASGFIKRSKRTMQNIEGFMNKLVRRTLRLKMQFEPDKYPLDYEFQVRGTLGIMAREIEQQSMTNLLQTVGADSPAAMPILKGIFEHSGSPIKSDVLAALKAIEEKAPDPAEEKARQAQLELPVAELIKVKAETAKLMAEAGLKDAQEDKTREEAQNEDLRGELESAKVFNDLSETQNQVRQLDLLEDKNQIEREKIAAQRKTKT